MSNRLVRTIPRTVALALGVVALASAGSAPASADAGVSRERIRVESEDQVNEFLTQGCGITVLVDSRLNIHVLEFPNGTSKVHINSWSTLSSTAGELSTIGTSMIQFDPEHVTDNGDGTHTIIVPHRETISFVYLIDGANLTDAGIVDWELRFVIDDSTGAVLNEHEVVVQTIGHFPVFTQTGGTLSLLCDVLAT